jgi:hypothetical protein
MVIFCAGQDVSRDGTEQGHVVENIASLFGDGSSSEARQAALMGRREVGINSQEEDWPGVK